MDWDKIIEEWDGVINREAIAEALLLASQVLGEKEHELAA